MIETTNHNWFAVSTPPGRSPPPATPQRLTLALLRVPVLVIEDEAMIAWMESLLEDMGFDHITLTSSAVEAATAAERQAPGLVISDINLGPGTDGVEAVSTIRHICNPAVVFVSAYIDKNTRSRISERVAGAHILSKPLTGNGLFIAIRNVLGARHELTVGPRMTQNRAC